MLELAGQYEILSLPLQSQFIHTGDQVLAFVRGDLLFVFNFNPSQSFSDYKIPACAGHYSVVLDSDAVQFAGHGRLDHSVEYVTNDGQLPVYLPTRTTIVLNLQREGAR